METTSRYGDPVELQELNDVRNALITRNLECFIAELFYDSKSGMCEIKISPTHAPTEEEKNRLFEIFNEHLSKFWWDSIAYVREPDMNEFQADRESS